MRLQRYRVSPTSYKITHKPFCDDPVQINREEARPAHGYTGISFEMFAPCRKCEKCLLFRQLKWSERIETEIERSLRTWHVTLTFAPVHLAGVIAESHARKYRKLSPDAAMERAAYAHVQKYLKRLRKSGARFRFFGVAEYGSEHGRLHYHLAIHELVEGCLTKRQIDSQWRSFVGAKLVKADEEGGHGVTYLTKYLTKQSIRPRASLRYGSQK